MDRQSSVFTLIPTLLWRALLALALWWVLAEGNMQGLGLGLSFALLAALSSLLVLPASPTDNGLARLLSWLGFIPFFLWQSLLGGIDVARRAYHPRMPLYPAVITYPLGLAEGWPRVFFLNTVSLLPGTLVVKLEGNTVRIHLLDGRGDPIPALRQIEERVAGLFLREKNRKGTKEEQ
jgi:multicomponent Na+:H+ antiporter subunit E